MVGPENLHVRIVVDIQGSRETVVRGVAAMMDEAGKADLGVVPVVGPVVQLELVEVHVSLGTDREAVDRWEELRSEDLAEAIVRVGAAVVLESNFAQNAVERFGLASPFAAAAGSKNGAPMDLEVLVVLGLVWVVLAQGLLDSVAGPEAVVGSLPEAGSV